MPFDPELHVMIIIVANVDFVALTVVLLTVPACSASYTGSTPIIVLAERAQ